MSPFGGSTADPEWACVDLRSFAGSQEQCSTLQVAYRLAFEVPAVSRVAVGTKDPAHLRALVVATELAVNDQAIGRYRRLITD